MSFELGEYMQRVDAMFDQVEGDFERVGQEFIVAATEMLVETTPGPGLQYEDTEYIATGRLRAGWTFGTNPPGSVSQDEGGPYDDRGIRTVARIRAQVFSTPLQTVTFVWNDVAYAYYVHYGLGNHSHIGPRPWVYDTSKHGQEFLAIAVERAKARA